MNKSALIVVVAAAAALLLLKQQQSGTGNGDENGEGGPTAGDDNSDPVTDGMNSLLSMVSGWPVGSAPYQQAITDAASQNSIPVSILAWLLYQESRFRPDIINGSTTSRAGALGIAQFMPATAAQVLGSTAAALDPSQAIPGAASYLASLYGQTGNWAAALAAYNWGIGNVLRKGLDAAPAETVNYYTTIMSKAGISA